ncbi:MAG: hypothetical protein ABI210_02880, partial [Abditibacteriaceae bacterium]
MSPTNSFHLLAIDPGTVKCGLAILNSHGEILFREISSTETIQNRLTPLIEEWKITHIVYGESTGAK